MERINANEVQSMMEAYASVYKTEEQEVISEETLAQKNARTQKENEEKLAAIAYLRRQRRERNQKMPVSNLPSDLKDTEQKATAAGQRVAGKPMGGLPADYKKTELEAGKTAERYRTGAGLPKSGGGNQGQGSKTAPKPSPNVTSDGTKFERRLPTSAELRAAQQARKDAPKVLSRGEIENRAVKAGVGVAKGTVKDPKIAADAARKAELERIRSRAASQTKAGVRPTVASTADPKTSPAAPAAKPAAAAPVPVVKKKPMGARNRMRMEELDVFDTIKEYLIGEGATEEEALKQMLTLTDEQRTEIIEGSCGSKSKKKKKGGY